VGAFLGIDIGGTNLKAAIVSSQGAVAAFDVVSWSAGGPDEAVPLIAAQRDRLVASADPGDLLGSGCGCAGLVDRDRGTVHASPNLPAWRDVQLARVLEDALGLPVVVENDANAAAYAEYLVGAARGASNVVMLTLGTGLGGGIVLGGEIYRGSHGSAGEIGHMAVSLEGPACPCGSTGCIERLVNAESIVRRAASLLDQGRPSSLRGRGSLTAKDVGDAARASDPLAAEAVGDAGRILGVGLANIVQVLDPDVIVIGGGIAEIGEPLLGPARAELRSRVASYHASTARIVPAELGEVAGVVGAALLARDVLHGV
jgi:glucokinase